MKKRNKTFPQNNNKETDDIDKFILSLSTKNYKIPYKTKQIIKKTIDFLYFNKN